MLESHLDPETIENNTGVNCIHSRNQTSFLPREPSFSGWCNEHGLVHLDCQVEISNAGEDSDFELPLLHGGELGRTLESSRNQCIAFKKGSMQLNGGSTTDVNSKHDAGGGNGNEEYVPFDIENGSTREISMSNIGVHGSSSIGNGGTLPPNTKNSIFAADVLKTLFFILMWYTFSTFLTLYNKTLLGDDMGRSPPPPTPTKSNLTPNTHEIKRNTQMKPSMKEENESNPIDAGFCGGRCFLLLGLLGFAAAATQHPNQTQSERRD